MKSVVLERELGHIAEACALVNLAVERYSEFWKLFLIAAQLQPDRARDIYKQAVRHLYHLPFRAHRPFHLPFSVLCPVQTYLFTLSLFVAPRVQLETCPKRAEIWCNAADRELAVSGAAKARSILDTARIKLPNNPAIWCGYPLTHLPLSTCRYAHCGG